MTENLEYVQKGFRILHPAMANYVALELIREYKDRWWEVVLSSLGNSGRDLPQTGEQSDLIDSLDVACCLFLINNQWGALFRRLMPRDSRSWAGELVGARNEVAHAGSKDMSQNVAERALDTMSLLAGVFSLEVEEEIRSLLRELRYGAPEGSVAVNQTGAAPAANAPQTDGGVMTTPPDSSFPSWREVIEPHPDVAQGRYLNSEFAANLAQVAKGGGAYEYRDPVEFFARTYITEGIKGLLIQAAKRLGGQAGEPVLQLKTAFGGGKTHSLLALYHMARGGVALTKTPNLKDALASAGISQAPNARVAVVVGTALDPAHSKRPSNLPGVTVSTVWGEIAAQLAISANDPKLYEYVKDADKKGVSPGSVALRELFDACGPCLVLMDELVAYAKKIYKVDSLPAGTFDNFISFIQEITEAASASKNSMVVASIPESDIEIGEGEGGRRALEAIEHTFGRKESIWKPVAASEGFEVVRRRLFLDCKKPEERDRVCAAFSQMYQSCQKDFPFDAKEVEYRERMVSCYPIHPEFFDLLYEEWATLDRFQRTRGVLRLMAAVIHELWMANDSSAMIMPGSIPLNVPVVREELCRYLPETWNSVFDSEVDGKNSVPFEQDKNIPRYGQKMASRRVARTILLGSAPTNRAQNLRGIEASHIRLGVVQPGENVADFNDALNTLRNSLTRLYSNASGSRYWYDTRPTLRKTAQDRASQLQDSRVDAEIEERLKKMKHRGGEFAGVHRCPASSGDVADEQTFRLVVLRPNETYRSGEEDCPALLKAEEILNFRGTSPRVYRNMLAFVAPDRSCLQDLKKSVRELLAWKSIVAERITLNLDAEQNTAASNCVERCEKSVETQLRETYSWLLVPYVDRAADITKVIWERDRLVGQEPVILSAAAAMNRSEQIVAKWAPTLLKKELDELLWKESEHIQVGKLWNFLTTYCYLPRLADLSVLEATIREGVAGDDMFALASSIRDSRYENLRYRVKVDEIYESDYLVRASVAREQLRRDEQKKENSTNAGAPAAPSGKNGETTNSGGAPTGPDAPDTPTSPVPKGPAPARNKHFFMTAKLDNVRANRDLQRFLEEVVTNLGAEDDCKVELVLEVNARSTQGFSKDTIRIVSENCRALKVDDFGFRD